VDRVKTTDRIRGTTPDIDAAAQRHRRNLTAAEQKLWTALSNRQLNDLKFRSQHPLGRFIADFYCAQVRLVIEVDGPVHSKQAEYDEARTQHFDTYGYQVVRFTNQEVLDNLPAVLANISQLATEILTLKQFTQR
jgi:very-short-patch-repair endonuclease